MSIVAALSELSGKRKAIEEQAREQAKSILAPGLQQFMTDHPEVAALRWSQYTPYFNDGDPCVFSVGELYYKLVGGDEEAGDEEDGFEYLSSYGKPAEFAQQPWYKALEELSSALSGSEDELLAAFGDHVQVIVTKAGVDVEEYSHD
jgi:hypothetical protein